MRRFLLIAPLALIGCSFQPMSDPEPLQPLPTTGLSKPNTPVDARTDKERDSEFLSNVRKNYSGPVPMTDFEMLASAHFWCNAYTSGMTRDEITQYIEETAVSTQQETFTKVIVTNAFLDICTAD